ncbi:MAG: PEP-CTERM sorting domain-containing protein, partial [Thermoguttaceae bacterium]|nr:PEP-CTERM sorting domain-containing protein [Thermoguttaceae bacterium]
QLPGNITGKGTVVFRTNAGSTLKMASNSVAKDATVEISGGNISVGNDFDGTLKAAENVTLTMPQNYTGSPYTMTLYEDTTDTTGAITPTMTENVELVKVYDEKVYDMSQAANSGDGNQVAKYIPNDYAALSYTNTITVLKDLTLDFTGQFDDTQGVWVKPLNADGTEIEGAEWQTLLNYAGKCAVNTATGVTLSAGTYLLDVRVGEYSGGQVAQARDAYNDFMGIGLRLNGTSNWFNFDVNTENGFVGLLDGSIVSGTAKTDAAFDGNFDIAEGKTVTFDNPHATMEKYDIDTTVTGKGTLKFTDSANSGVEFDVNIDSEGSVIFTDGVNVGLTLDLENLDTLLSADNVTFEGNNEVNLYLNGEAPETVELLTIIETSDTDSLVGFELSDLNIFAEDDNTRWVANLSNGLLTLKLGDSVALPEPSSWFIFLAGAFGLMMIRRKKTIH